MKTLCTFLLSALALPAMADTRLSGSIRNTAGQPIADLTVHFYHRNGAGFDHLTATTAADGKWSIVLPPGEWRAAARSNDILKRGYFCFPGFIWCGESGDLCGGDPWPPLWGGGGIEWELVPDPGQVDLTIVPTRPDLSVQKPRTVDAGVKVSFETTAEPITTIRQWRIEKSADLVAWTPIKTVALSGPSPVVVPDPDSEASAICYYRAVQVEDVVPAQ